MTNSVDTEPQGGQLSVLLAVCLAALVLPLSFSGAAMATHTIGAELDGSASAMNWITNAFMLTFGGFLLPAGAFADVYGRKRVFVFGVILFALASLSLSFSGSLLTLNVLRAVQGLAAAAALAGGSAALAQEFEGTARTRAFSMIGTTFGVGLAFGPLISGLLIESFGWRSIFLSGTVIGLLSLSIALPRMTESRNPDATSFDWFGALTFSGMLALLTSGLIAGPADGWTGPRVVMLFAGSIVSLGAFIAIENRVAQPLLQLSLFRYGRFVGVQVLPIATCYAYVVLLILLPLRFVGIEGYSEVSAGLLMLALSGPMVVVPVLAAIGARFVSAGTLSGGGLVLAAAGLFWLSLVGIETPALNLVYPLLLIGVGASIPWGLMDGLSVTVVPKERAGMASGIFNTTKVAGEGIALAMVSAILGAFVHATLRGSLPASIDPVALGEASMQLATGDLSRASAILGPDASSGLATVYGSSFDGLLYVLIVITLLAAAIVFALLGNPRTGKGAAEKDAQIRTAHTAP